MSSAFANCRRARGPASQLADGRVLLWHCNYHPDGGQLFWPIDGQPFVVPVAPPGDDLKPETFVAFWSDGSFGIYIHPGIWHEGVFPVTPTGRFFDKQGKVHARVSCDLAREFGMLLGVPLPHAMYLWRMAPGQRHRSVRCRGWRTPGC